MKNLKALTVLVLCLSLLLSTTVTASAAQSVKAATLRLEKTQGTVTVTNASGTEKKATQNMKLLSGYTVSTGKASYAYISLDDSKAIKLDASSKVSVHKAGKKLEIKVVSGKVMFNVSAPLTSQESMTIRTSTMVTGVRGTAGWVETEGNTNSSVYLLEGSLNVQILGSGGSGTPVHLSSGQMLNSTTPSEGPSAGPVGGDGSSNQPTNFTVDNVPGFVGTEVAANPELQKRMEENGSPIDPNAVADGADDKLKQDESNADKQDQQIQQQEQQSTSDAQQNQNSNDTLFDNNSSEQGSIPTPGIGSGSGSGTVPEPEPKPEDPAPEDPTPEDPAPEDPTPEDPTPEPEPLIDPTVEEITEAFATHDTVSVTFTEPEVPEDGTDPVIPTISGLVIPAKKTLNVTSGMMTVAASEDNSDQSPLEINGTLNVNAGSMLFTSGTATNNGTLNVDADGMVFAEANVINAGTILNNGSLTLDSCTLTNQSGSTFTNRGSVSILEHSGDLIAELSNESGSTFLNDTDGIIMAGYASYNADGSIGEYYGGRITFKGYSAVNNGTISICGNNGFNGTATIAENAKLDNKGTIVIEGLYNYGTELIINDTLDNSGQILVGYGSLENKGTFNNNGTLGIEAGSFLTIDSSCRLNNYGTLTNEGTVTVSGSLNNEAPSSVDSSVCIINSGTLTINTGAELYNVSQITNSGTIENNGRIYEAVIKRTVTNGDEYVSSRFINDENGIIENFGTLEMGSYDDQLAEFTNYGQFTNDNTVSNGGHFTTAGKFTNNETFTLVKPGTLTINGNATNYGTININDGCTMTIVEGCTLTNNGKIENGGKISGEDLIIPPSEGDDGSTSEGGDSTTTEGSDGSAT